MKILTYCEGAVWTDYKVQTFIRSANAVGHEVEVLTRESGQLNGATVVRFPDIEGRGIFARRWDALRKYLSRSTSSQDQYLFCDCRDIVFQADPYDAHYAEYDLVLASEYQIREEHSWVSNQYTELAKYNPSYKWRGHCELNGGVVMGKAPALDYFAGRILDIYSFLPQNIITDQAVINYLYDTDPVISKAIIGDKAWYCHGESVKTKKIKVALREHTEASDRPGVLEKAAFVDDTPHAAAIYHQYDRIPEHASYFTASHMPSRQQADVGIVACRFRESVNWVKEFPLVPILILNRGEKEFAIPTAAPTANMPLQIEVVQQENIGFEANAWCLYFHDFYDELPRVSVCLQANWTDHLKKEEFQKTLNNIGREFSYALLATPGHGEFCWLDANESHANLPLREAWEFLFDVPPPARFPVWFGGQFAVTRSAIQSRPKEFWKLLAEWCVTKERACCLERLWGFILQPGLPTKFENSKEYRQAQEKRLKEVKKELSK